MADTTRTRVLSVISEHAGDMAVSLITDELNLSQGLGMDPQDTAEMINALEDEFGIFIDFRDDPGPLTTVGEVIRLVEDKVSRLPVGAV
jgi:acyl carrier protein